jgi:diguanylate cyclase (GGDEF)-like protein
MYLTKYLIIIILLTQFHTVYGQDKQSKLIQPRLIKIGITHAPPLVYLNENQPPVGMMIDFLNAVAKKENWKIVWVKGKWSDIFEKAKNKEIDIMSYIAYSQQRSVYFNFSQISFVTGWGQVYTYDKDKFQNIFDYNNKTVALVKDDIHAKGFIEFCQKFNVNCQLKFVDNYDIAFNLLEQKLVDGAVCGSTVGHTYEKKFDVVRTSIMYQPTDALFATPKNRSTHLLKVIDKYLILWKKDPQSPYSLSKHKWMQGMQSNSLPSWIIFLVVIILTLLIIAAIFVSLLRQKIKNHVKQHVNQSKQLKQIINLVPHMIYVVDAHGKVVLANNYASNHFGISSSINATTTELIREIPEYTSLFNDDKNLLLTKEEIVNKEITTQNYTEDKVVFNVSKLSFDDWNNIPSVLTVGVDITEELAYQNKIQFIAEHDDLTGLPNRELIKQSIKKSILKAKQLKSMGGVLYIDLDFFKNVNDSLGHAAGDELLKIVSARLQSCIGKNDRLARIGGDEFIIELKNLTPDINAAQRHIKDIAIKVLNVISDKFVIWQNELYISASIGIVIYPVDAQSYVQTMQRADIAMYQAKANGKNGYVLFKQEMEDVVQQKHTLVADLHKAVEDEDFTLVYQPQVYGSHKKIVGLEALIRWKKPDGSFVYPTDFISEAEECGLIIPIGDWVMEQVCLQISKWLKHYENIPMVTVNVSVLQFHNREFFYKLKRLIKTYGIPPHLIELEVTESIMVDRIDSITYTLTQLKNLGIKISIDDFGTGYSSLSYLKKLPIDKLKIDYSFIKDMINDADTNSLVRTIVGMTQDLGLEVIAEGVENIEQVQQLMQMGCHYFQGFYFDPPQSVSYIEKKYFTKRNSNN